MVLFNEEMKFKKYKDLPSRINFLVQDRFAFASANINLVKIIIQEVQTLSLIRKKLLLSFQPVLPEFINIIQAVLKKDDRVNKELREDVILRIIIAPIFT
ncbi:hypothetical protein KMP11_06545 [Gemella sp. zg-570]|uniref:hypothetical protein n=1 Tax=Gemella sp. zg-570 TaxID=2840371 RepID=UPI001C0C102B|nr:hypothetical protein [Gemella sp. zg-570]QWQ38601.1 hypothetical protein KMP11_06545 [Gemella sp. zg-570]